MFHGNSHKNCETAQRLVCHFDLSSQIARLKGAMGKKTVFCSNAVHINNYVRFIVDGDINLHKRIVVQHTDFIVMFPLEY